MQDTAAFPVVAVIPSLNPDERLINVVKGIRERGFTDVIIVDDGSREDCRTYFERVSEERGCVVLRHERNQGKGAALKTAFSYYLERYDLSVYCGVVTADADGQHLAGDIYAVAGTLIELTFDRGGAEASSHTLILGTREFDAPGVPFKSRFGNHVTTLVFRFLFGIWIRDTQTGLRGISTSFLPECVKLPGNRFEYEIQMLSEAVSRRANIAQVPIGTVYLDGNRETHFHPLKDSVRIYRVMLAPFARFACSGLLSLAVDQGLFALFVRLLEKSLSGGYGILVSTAAARVISSLLNYKLNRDAVFHSVERGSLFRYYALCVAQMLASAGGVALLWRLTGTNKSLLKLLTDSALFFLSYYAQRKWVFRR